MKLPRIRLTVRRLMVIVAVAAIAFWLGERSYRFRRLAEHHRSRSGYLGFTMGTGVLQLTGEGGKSISQDLSDWHEMLEEKYARAARYPWLPVAPDPPEPE